MTLSGGKVLTILSFHSVGILLKPDEWNDNDGYWISQQVIPKGLFPWDALSCHTDRSLCLANDRRSKTKPRLIFQRTKIALHLSYESRNVVLICCLNLLVEVRVSMSTAWFLSPCGWTLGRWYLTNSKKWKTLHGAKRLSSKNHLIAIYLEMRDILDDCWCKKTRKEQHWKKVKGRGMALAFINNCVWYE